MSLFGCNCSCRPSCSGLGVIAAAILGVLVAFLQIAGVVAISAALTGVFFAIAVGYLAVITVAAALARRTAGGCCQRFLAPSLWRCCCWWLISPSAACWGQFWPELWYSSSL